MRVSTESIPGGLRVLVQAASPIVGVQMGRAQNASVSVPTISGVGASFTATRLGPGPLTVPFVVTDGCGPWASFAGVGS